MIHTTLTIAAAAHREEPAIFDRLVESVAHNPLSDFIKRKFDLLVSSPWVPVSLIPERYLDRNLGDPEVTVTEGGKPLNVATQLIPRQRGDLGKQAVLGVYADMSYDLS